jgi:excisionase family DNA binding protein
MRVKHKASAKELGSKRDLSLKEIIMANETKYGLPRVMTVKDLSEYLRLHPSTIYKLLRHGELPAFRIGTDWRFNTEVIDRWCLERNTRISRGDTSHEN